MDLLLRLKQISVSLLFLSIFMVQALFADTVRTTQDTIFSGKIIQQDGEQVIIETKSGEITIPRSIIKEIRLDSMDYRSASEKIEETKIEIDKIPLFLNKIEEHFKNGEMEETVSIYKGLSALGNALSDKQRGSIGNIAARAYFELDDWPASAEAIRRVAILIKEDVDKKRLLAVAEALEENKSPSIGSQTIDGFDHAIKSAMKWKADKIFDKAFSFVQDAKEINRRSNVDQALNIANIHLSEAEMYVPGYSFQRKQEFVKEMVDRMISSVQKAKIICTEDRKDLKRNYVGGVTDRKHAEAWNKQCQVYLDIIDASRSCLNNIKQLGQENSIEELYDTAEHEKLVKEIQELQFYDSDIQAGQRAIKVNGKKISLMKIGYN